MDGDEMGAEQIREVNKVLSTTIILELYMMHNIDFVNLDISNV